MLDEGLEALTQVWSGEPVVHEGNHYTVHVHNLPGYDHSAHFDPKPVQVPRIPIWVDGVWPNRRPFRRAARWDGVIPLREGVDLGEMMAPAELADIVAYVRRHRGPDDPIEVVMAGHTGGEDRPRDVAVVSAYAAVGATWWLESVSPFDFGWTWHGPWPMDEMRARIREGPPRL
jgi:hypothetical protein